MLFGAYAVEDCRAAQPSASMPSAILISRTSGGQTQPGSTPRMGDFIPPGFLPALPVRKLQVTSGAKSETTRNEMADEELFFSINAGVRGVD
jgi:hypothetical protein